MFESLTLVLAVGAVTLGSLHTLAPDHWVPFAALSRAQGWSRLRTARITALCGFGHVTVSVLLGVLALAFGLEMLHVVGRRMESIAGLLLIAFGLVYAVLGLRRAAGERFHGHSHHHYDHVHEPSKMTPWALFLLFSADPCVAVIPILFAAAPLGAVRTIFVVCAYELATIATMVALVLPARAAVNRLHAPWIARYGDAAAGAVIAAVGVFVAVLGI
jgi:nickel/cobalt transporter (NicO) family protein